MSATLSCRPGCGACCIAPSISSPIPGMPQGKPAGSRCVQLDDDMRCRIFGHPDRPDVCSSLQPSTELCAHRSVDGRRYRRRQPTARSRNRVSYKVS
ncbi:YkgJ family cysteine cluster protein [Bordetella pertussis]|uniref:YkgJ family cysteine cluster protein n=1 Tax=Bordetella pertussis TaxID=520 RepID=UPI000A4FBB69|nr:YkgJ family cysteine cluster protein [Bordetella pertussis]